MSENQEVKKADEPLDPKAYKMMCILIRMSGGTIAEDALPEDEKAALAEEKQQALVREYEKKLLALPHTKVAEPSVKAVAK